MLFFKDGFIFEYTVTVFRHARRRALVHYRWLLAYHSVVGNWSLSPFVIPRVFSSFQLGPFIYLKRSTSQPSKSQTVYWPQALIFPVSTSQMLGLYIDAPHTWHSIFKNYFSMSVDAENWQGLLFGIVKCTFTSWVNYRGSF